MLLKRSLIIITVLFLFDLFQIKPKNKNFKKNENVYKKRLKKNCWRWRNEQLFLVRTYSWLTLVEVILTDTDDTNFCSISGLDSV